MVKYEQALSSDSNLRLMPRLVGIENLLPYLYYSEQKNRLTKGQISLVSQIAAQITKINLWEIPRTQVDILSFAMPKYRSLVPAIGFIFIYNVVPSMRQFFCQCTVVPLFAFITASIDLAMFLITFL